ncbi:MAG TPA: hypothetical protein GXZ96_06875 [Firmicutes bacterium]|nr:hypothetical protein [Bacillota bacterium]
MFSIWGKHGKQVHLPAAGGQEVEGAAKRRTHRVCVEVVKVYDSCFQCECVEDLSVTPPVGQCDPAMIQGMVGNVVSFGCQFGEDLNIPGLPGRRRVTFTWTVRVTVTYTAVDGTTQTAVDTFTFAKDVPLFVAPGFEDVMFCKFFARFEFLRQRIVGRNFFFDLGQTLLFKTAADVQLEIDTYGECVPPLCEAIPTACEEFELRCEMSPPSFNPPQPSEVD